MPETIESKSLSKNDVIQAFGDRVLWKSEKAEKEYLGLNENLTQQDLVGENIADKYEQAKITDLNTYNPHDDLGEEFLSRFVFFKAMERPLSAKLISSSLNPVTLVTGRYTQNFKQKNEEEKRNSFCNIFVLKGDLAGMNPDDIRQARMSQEKQLAHLQMTFKDGDTFSLHHRFVQHQYRGSQNNSKESLGDVAIKACEQIAQSYANKENKPKKIELDPGQIDVMLWLYKNGYTPKTDKDKERFEKVINADESLIIVDDNYIWEKDKWIPGTNVVENRHEGFTIIFEKTIEPETESLDKVVKETRDKIAGLA
jgi:hypothetical protein